MVRRGSMSSFKVGCKTTDTEPWAYNALRFGTEAEASAYGADLYSRWLMLKEWEVHPDEEEPNYEIKDGATRRLENA
jgi:hypothetical protein